MGQNNRKRRAAKARKRDGTKRRRRAEEARWNEPSGAFYEAGPPPPLSALISTAMYAEQLGDAGRARQAVERILAHPRPKVASALQTLLERRLPDLWATGWQPADVVRSVAKHLGRHGEEVLRCAIAVDAAGYEEAGAQVAPEWMAQLAAIDATRWWDPERDWLTAVDADWETTVYAVIRLGAVLARAPRIPQLTPPPSEWHNLAAIGGGPTTHLPDSVLAKIRSLLAKAESTTFEAEAEALAAKAQEMMTRHRIDRVRVEDRTETPGEEPRGRRMGIDDPYAVARATLLGGIARANGCHAVWSKDLGFSTVFGLTEDLEAVEELFTSLLVQATAALRREGSKTDRRGRSRTARFRRSFLVAFAHRISTRLSATAATTVGIVEAETGVALVPILAQRDEGAHDAARRAFGKFKSFSTSASDAEGWAAGTRLADTADLSTGSPDAAEAAIPLPLDRRTAPGGGR